MQDEPDVGSVGILEDVIDPGRVESAGSSDYAVNFVSARQEILCKVRSVLSGDSSYQRFPHQLSSRGLERVSLLSYINALSFM